jgi:large subunit ribosomal protein L11
MAKETVEILIDGGKATPGPPLGPAIGPLGINMMQVVEEINKKTADFEGMKVPVKVIVDIGTKEFEVTVGTPPTTALIIDELNLDKGSQDPGLDKVADLKVEH